MVRRFLSAHHHHPQKAAFVFLLLAKQSLRIRISGTFLDLCRCVALAQRTAYSFAWHVLVVAIGNTGPFLFIFVFLADYLWYVSCSDSGILQRLMKHVPLYPVEEDRTHKHKLATDCGWLRVIRRSCLGFGKLPRDEKQLA